MYDKKSIETCEKELNTSLNNGLDSSEANRRLIKNGKNILEDSKKKNIMNIFLSQLNDPMIYILFAAIVISLILGEYGDSIIIITVVILNATIGTFQEEKAEKALDALKKMSASTCIVRRDSTIRRIKTEELVVGDVIEIEAGQTVSADLRIVESNNLKIEESSLTGESVPVMKDANIVFNKEVPLGDKVNMAFMSTNIVNGRGRGIVVSTGMNTQVGKIAAMLKNEKDEMTPLQKRLADLGKLLGVLTIVLCLSLFIIAIFQERDKYAMLLNAISLAVAAIPEGLPAVVTIVLALGVQRMVKVNTIVRKLPSVETLGAVSVVCSDKTGTLTQNKMTILELYCNNCKYIVDEAKNCQLLIEGMSLCNDAVIENDKRIGDPTEIALIELGNKFGLEKEKINKKYKRVNEIPFDSNRKMMTTLHDYGYKKRMYTKGALDAIIRRCNKININGMERNLSSDDINVINDISHQMTQKALRVLALAYKDTSCMEETNMVFVGFVGMIDPPRSEVKESIQIFKEAGIDTVMITGDHIDTAYSIARELKIAEDMSQCVSGEQLNRLSQEELNEKIESLRVFARVTPEHKVMIVKAFKSKGKIVSMTGDGVNDAPSLKAADIGIAMGLTGTDVAKGAADMILIDDNFSSIEKAIEEGRTIYANIKKSVLFLLSSNFAEIISMFLAILFGLPVPLIAVHILWINLLTDSIPALALGSDPKDSDVMKEKPRNPKDSLFAHGGLNSTLFYGLLIAGLTLIAFLSVPLAEACLLGGKVDYSTVIEMLDNSLTLRKAQTFAFVTLAICELLHAIGMRNVNKSFIRKDFFSNKLMIFATSIGVLLLVLITEFSVFNVFFKTSKLEFAEWCFLLGLSSMILVIHEIIILIKNIKGYKKQNM